MEVGGLERILNLYPDIVEGKYENSTFTNYFSIINYYELYHNISRYFT